MKNKATIALFDAVKRKCFQISKQSKINNNYLLITDKWKQIIGEKLSKYMFPSKISNKVLHIEVNSTSAMSQSTYIKEEVILKIKNFLPESAIKDIKFFLTKKPSEPTEFDFALQESSFENDEKSKKESEKEEDPLKKSLLKLSKHIK